MCTEFQTVRLQYWRPSSNFSVGQQIIHHQNNLARERRRPFPAVVSPHRKETTAGSTSTFARGTEGQQNDLKKQQLSLQSLVVLTLE